MDWFRGPIPQEDQILKLPLVTGGPRGDKSVRNPLESTGRTGPMSLSQREVSAVAEAGRAEIVLSKPSRCQAADMTVKGTKMDTRASIRYRCCDCGTQMMTGHHFVMTEDKDMEPRPIRMYPVKMDCDPIKGETVLVRPMNFLDVPALRLPGGFLKLAEEARNSEGVDNRPSGMSIVHSQRSGRTGRTMITEIESSFPGSGSEDSRSSRTSTEVIPNLNIVKPVIRLGPVGRLKDTAQLIMPGNTTNPGRISPPGPVGQNVRRTGYMDVMAKPDPVGPYEDRDESVSPEINEGQAGHHIQPVADGPAGLVRTRRPVGPYEDRDESVSPEINEGQAGHHIQPVADGPAGLVRTRRPVGDVMLPALQDGVRPSAGGPVGQVPDPCVQVRSKNSSPVDSYQPLVTGPVGANVSDALKDACPPVVGDQVDRSTRLDPVGPREMFSLGDVAKPASMGPVGRPWTTGQLEIESDEPDFVRSSPTRSESDMDTEILPPVIKTEGEVFRGRVRPSVVMEKTEPSEVMCSPGVQFNTAEGSSDSPSVNPDPVIRTGADGRTDDMKSEMIKGQSDSSVVSPSSDSGVHSVDEQWECMSTYSGDSDSIQSVKTVYGGVACQTDSPVVTLRNMDTRGVIHPLKGPHGDHDSMSSLSTNGHNSDIADMGDFSDGEDEQWEEVEPSVRTSVCTSSNDASSSSERSELPKTPTVVTPHDMEIHDEDYWTNFRLLAKQAFKLDNVELAASDYPVAVKELVVRSRVTIQDINDRADRWFAEQQELEAAGETVASNFLYSDTDRLEDFTIPVRDWCHKRSPIIHDQATDTAYRSVENADEAEGQDVTLAMDSLADNVDMCSDPDARAKFELSPTKHVIALENIGVNCASDGDVTVMGENVAGDTVAHEGENIRVSPSAGHGIDRPVNAERSVYTNTGPLGFQVTLGGHITDWPDPVEPPGTMEQMMFSAQPVAAGLSDPIAVRRSVDVHDAVGLEVGGPVGRFPYSELRQTDVESILHSNRRDDVVASRSGTTEHPDDRSGDIDCADTTYDESDKFAGEWDPLVEKDNGCQLVRVNGGLDDCLTNSRDVSGSSDSGVQSWMEQWDNMSDNSMDGSYVDTGDLHRSVSDELARLLFDAPPNTEDEDASGSPGTDTCATSPSPSRQPEAMFDDDRNLSCNDMTDSEYDSNSDLEEHSDVSDDSSVLGIRKVLRRRVPYRGRAPLPRKGCARAPRTPPVPPRNRAEQWLLEHNSIRSSWARWSYGYMMDYTSERFVPFIRALTDLCLEEGEDPRRDRYYPKLVQSLARAGRVVWTVPRCHENHRLRRDWMLRLFDEEMEKSDLACDRFPDRQADLVAGTTAGRPPPTEVRETFTPPIRRCLRRKSAALRECLSDVEDYFENAAEEGLWTARALAWYQPCL